MHERKHSARLKEAERSPLRESEASNDLWRIDYKGQFRSGDGVLCYPRTSTEEARNSMERLFRERGPPRRMRSDNGAPFASTGAGGLSRLNVWWLKLGIEVERIDPGKPQQNGKHERMHRTLKAETARPPASDGRSQQRRFDRFRKEYNEERPHEAQDQRPPATAYEATTRSYPEELVDPQCPGHWELRRVRHDGRVKFHGQKYFLSEALAQELVGWLEVDEAIWQIWFGPVETVLYDAANRQLWPPPILLPLRPV